jgi:hypothetical protein
MTYGPNKLKFGLAITFRRNGEPDDRRIAVDGVEAVFIALGVITLLDDLRAGVAD